MENKVSGIKLCRYEKYVVKCLSISIMKDSDIFVRIGGLVNIRTGACQMSSC